MNQKLICSSIFRVFRSRINQNSSRDVSFHIWTMLKRRPTKPLIHIVVSNNKPNSAQELISRLANVVKEFKSLDPFCRYARDEIQPYVDTLFCINFGRSAMTCLRCSNGDLTAVRVWIFKFNSFFRLWISHLRHVHTAIVLFSMAVRLVRYQ